MSTNTPRVVFKLGGSLLSLPGLAERLSQALQPWKDARRLLVVGGGPVADFVKDMDTLHHFGEEAGHWLAVRGLVFNSHLAASFLPRAKVVSSLSSCDEVWSNCGLAILDTFEFLRDDEKNSLQPLPHRWELTSDSIAARVAEAAGAAELVLLKSTSLQPGAGLEEAAQRGWVDPFFPRYALRIPHIRWINLRAEALSIATLV